jgi:hypothetical protein
MGLLEERELGARQRVESLREEADRVLAALRDAELAWERFVITRETLDEVLAPSGEPEAAESSGVERVTPRSAAGPARWRVRWCRHGVRDWVCRRCRRTTSGS